MQDEQIPWNADELKKAPEFLRALLESLNSAILLVDRKREVRSFNEFFAKIFQIEDEAVLGQRCGEILGCRYVEDEQMRCGETSACAQCPLRAAVDATVNQSVEMDRELITREFYIGGELVEKHMICSVRSAAFRGEPLAVVVLDDVTEIEGQRQRLEELNQMKNDFLGMAVHDLRNPLSVVHTYIEVLLSGKMGDLGEKQRLILKNGEKALKGMFGLVSDLLDLNAIESGSLELDRRLLDLHSFLSGLVAQQQLLAERKHIKVALESLPALPKVLADENRLTQVFENLVSNAVKYSPENTTVQIGASARDGFVVISVNDEGPGIPEKDRENIFQSFGKTTNIPTGGEHSTGLGLAIVKRIVEAHGGSVRVESEVGEGASFFVSVPVVG